MSLFTELGRGKTADSICRDQQLPKGRFADPGVPAGGRGRKQKGQGETEKKCFTHTHPGEIGMKRIFRQVFQEKKKKVWQIGEREERTEGPSSGCLCLPVGGGFSGPRPAAHRRLPDPAAPPTGVPTCQPGLQARLAPECPCSGPPVSVLSSPSGGV